MSGYQTIKVFSDVRGVMTVTLNRPEVRNAFNGIVVDELARAFGVDAHSTDVRAVVLRGEGKVFSAGGDVHWLRKALGNSSAENLQETQRLAQMFAVLNECPKPLIGVVHGAAIGGGVGLVSVCDWVISPVDTIFSLSEVRLGVVPACIGPFVLQKIGASHARALFVSAERINAVRAREIGLIHGTVADSAAIEPELNRILESVLQCGPNAMAVAKKLVLDLSWPERRAGIPNCLDYVAKVLADIRVSPEGQEGINAFLEERKPSWVQNNQKT